MPGADPPTIHGIAACLALLEQEARTLDRPLAALLIAAAGEALREASRADAAEPAAACANADRNAGPDAQRRSTIA